MIDTVNGANSSAIIYSIAETAKANNLKPFDYFEYLLTEISKHVDDKNTDFLAELLPWSDMLPENIRKPQKASEMLRHNGFITIEFSHNIAVIKTRPGYASSLAYDIDMHNFHEIIGTIAGDDTIMLVIRENCTRTEVKHALANIIPNINQL